MNNIPGNASQQPTNSGNEDYLDKGLDSAEKKFGGSMGQNTEKNRGVNEKIVSYFRRRRINDVHVANRCERPTVLATCSRRLPERTYLTRSQTECSTRSSIVVEAFGGLSV
jgi:hypothetical protein